MYFLLNFFHKLLLSFQKGKNMKNKKVNQVDGKNIVIVIGNKNEVSVVNTDTQDNHDNNVNVNKKSIARLIKDFCISLISVFKQ